MKKYLGYLPQISLLVLLLIGAFALLSCSSNYETTTDIIDETDLMEEEVSISISEAPEESEVVIENTVADPLESETDNESVNEPITETVCDETVCDELLIISKASQEQLENRIGSIQTKTGTTFLDLEEYNTQLISKENIFTQEEYQNLISSYQGYYTLVNSNVSSYSNSLTNLKSQISSLSTVEELEFSLQVNTIAKSLQNLNSDLRNQLIVFYTSFNAQTKINDPDLMVSDIVINRIVKDNDIIFINLMVKNVGNDEADVMFTYHFDFEINGNYVDKCSGEAERLDPLAQVLIECEFNIEEYYDELVDGDVNVIILELAGEIDSHSEIREISEENNDFVWYTDLDIADFN